MYGTYVALCNICDLCDAWSNACLAINVCTVSAMHVPHVMYVCRLYVTAMSCHVMSCHVMHRMKLHVK